MPQAIITATFRRLLMRALTAMIAAAHEIYRRRHRPSSISRPMIAPRRCGGADCRLGQLPMPYHRLCRRRGGAMARMPTPSSARRRVSGSPASRAVARDSRLCRRDGAPPVPEGALSGAFIFMSILVICRRISGGRSSLGRQSDAAAARGSHRRSPTRRAGTSRAPSFQQSPPPVFATLVPLPPPALATGGRRPRHFIVAR